MPDSIDDLGLSSTVITDLILRRAYVAGTSTLSSLSKALKLSTVVVETIFRELRQQQLIEVKGMVGNDYAFTLTNAGRSAAQERYLLSRYAGPAPVPLKQYARAVSKYYVLRKRLS
jgi:hypothetical protein